MIQGHIDESLQPIIEIGLVAGLSVTITPVVIDTGFNGDLCLSMRWFGDMELQHFHTREYELANGDVITADLFRGRIEIDGEQRMVEVLLTDSNDNLIGASLLKDRTLFIDYPAREVRIE